MTQATQDQAAGSTEKTNASAGGSGGTRRVALVGAGYIAEWHAQGLRSVKNVELVAVCDRVLRRAQALATKFGVAHVYGSLNEMLGRRDSTRCMFCCLRTSILRRRARRLRPA